MSGSEQQDPDGETGRAGEVTALLVQMADGDPSVVDALFQLVYSELRNIARGQRRRNAANSTLDSTALLHEAYLRFAGADPGVYQHRQHFYAVAARAMRQILVDNARRRRAKKRGGDVDLSPLLTNDHDAAKLDQQADFLIALDQGLRQLGEHSERVRQVVELRFFGGFTEEETAEILDVNGRTVRRDWSKAKAWLVVELGLDPAILNEG